MTFTTFSYPDYLTEALGFLPSLDLPEFYNSVGVADVVPESRNLTAPIGAAIGGVGAAIGAGLLRSKKAATTLPDIAVKKPNKALAASLGLGLGGATLLGANYLHNKQNTTS